MAWPTPTHVVIRLALLVLQQHLENSVEDQGADGQAVH